MIFTFSLKYLLSGCNICSYLGGADGNTAPEAQEEKEDEPKRNGRCIGSEN
jgi:hypothetical protein